MSFAWSYTTISEWMKCPALYKYRRILKMPEPPSPALKRGIEIHTEAEHYLLGGIRRVPASLQHFAEQFKALRKSGARPEQAWNFRRGWVHGPHGVFDREAWLRVKTDAHVLQGEMLTVIDFKTGKEYDSHADQKDLYALAGLKMEPAAQIVKVEFWYLDSGLEKWDDVERKAEPALTKKWERLAAKMEADKDHKPTPNPGCRWCSFAKSKGGPCPHA